MRAVPRFQSCVRHQACAPRLQTCAGSTGQAGSASKRDEAHEHAANLCHIGLTPGDPHTIPLRVLYPVHCTSSTHSLHHHRARQRPKSITPFVCACAFLACACPAPTCASPSRTQGRHLPARALPMPCAFYLHVFARPLLWTFHLQTLCACPWALLCPVRMGV